MKLRYFAAFVSLASTLTTVAAHAQTGQTGLYLNPIAIRAGNSYADSGPYAFLRHPGYVAASLMFVGIALSLGSLWALVPAVVSCLLLVVRTVLEDKTLRNELPGYEEYAQRVRYRLVPGVW